MTVDAYVNKIHVSGGLGGQVSATYTLAVPQHTGQAYHHELWKHQVPVSLLVANSTTLRRAVSSAAHKFQFFARSSDFDTGVQVDSEISFLSFARKSASATPVLSPWNWASTSQYSRSYFSGSAANSIFLAFFSKRFSVQYGISIRVPVY